MADVDIEAVNRLRVTMGLKPIPVPNASGPSFKDSNDVEEEDLGSTLETREAAAGDNWAKAQADAAAKVKRKAQKEAIRKARDIAQRNVRLSGKTLGDEDDELDTTSWLKSQGKRQKEIEKQRKLEEERLAKEKASRVDYSAKDLAGVKVAHEVGQFESGNEQILTLKDAIIGDESEDDELENVELREDEKLKKRLELKKKKPVYNPNDDDDETGERSVLRQYDEEIDGEKGNAFTLDGQGSTREAASKAAQNAQLSSRGITINLDILRDDKPVSDYVDISEIKIKKPKKKKSKSTRKKAVDEDDIFTTVTGDMEVDTTAATTSNIKKRSYNDTQFADDDDLQAKLAQQRREALKKKKRIRPEDIAKQLREEEENQMDGLEDAAEEEAGLVFDETSEFVTHIQPEDQEESSRPRKRQKSIEALPDSDEDGDVQMEQVHDGVDKTSKAADFTTTGLEEENSIEQGLGATLAMLKQRRLIEEKEEDLNANYRGHDAFIAEKRARRDDAERETKLQRERDRQSGRLDRMSVREREEYARSANNRREQMESRAVADLFNKEYKPNVELKYVDEFGRRMNEKEAFKHLSHQFHGKSSGKAKHEKRLKKIEEEKKKEAASVIDGSKITKSQKSAGVRLF